jgi:hypothetical protein
MGELHMIGAGKPSPSDCTLLPPVPYKEQNITAVTNFYTVFHISQVSFKRYDCKLMMQKQLSNLNTYAIINTDYLRHNLQVLRSDSDSDHP